MTLTDLGRNPFVGYLKFYLCALWTSPLCYKLVQRCKWNKIFVFALPFVGIVLRKFVMKICGDVDIIETYALYIPYLLTGMIICKTEFYKKVFTAIGNSKAFLPLVVISMIGIVFIRNLAGHHALSFDSWFASAFIFMIAACFQYILKIKKWFAWLGKYSTNLWYSHAIWIFSGVTMQKILYAPRIPLAILIWGIILCMPGAMVVNWIMEKVFYFLNR